MNENSFTKSNGEEEIKVEALVDNTAQSIFNYLKEIENKREIYEKRWVWELLQNALDAVPEERKVEVTIIKNGNELIFRHDGRPFKREEVAHLIYHGSTKKEEDYGKFGTGFLVTHLLSKKVKVRGAREDGEIFEFILNRQGTSFEEIKNLMEETWCAYKESLQIKKDLHYTAEYTYPLNDISLKTAEEGLNVLTKIAPYVLAFTDKLKAIKLVNENHRLKFELVDEKSEDAYTTKEVLEETEGRSSLHYLWTKRNEEVEVAVKGEKQSDGTYRIESLRNIPKIFIAFPLVGTDQLSFPAVINSKKFEPLERRDGIFLGKEETDDIKRNKNLLKTAMNLFIELIPNIDSNQWRNIHVLLDLGNLPDKDWLDPDWYTDFLKGLIDAVMDLSVIRTEDGTFITPREALIPYIKDVEEREEKVKQLWQLCYQFIEYRDQLPTETLAIEWEEIFIGWERVGLDLTEEKITVEKLSEDLERCENLTNFKNKLGEDVDEIDILNKYYGLLIDTNKISLLEEKNILPNQNKTLVGKQGLYKDEGIDERLKNISCKLGEDVRKQLIHLEVSERIQSTLNSKTEEDVLARVMSLVRTPQTENAQYLQANTELFDWLLGGNRYEHLQGYPVLSQKEGTFIALKEGETLAPPDVWTEEAKNYVDLFPEEHIISYQYSRRVPQRDKWEILKEKGFILIEPLYREKGRLSGDALDALLLLEEKLEEEKDHDVTGEIELSKIAFLETKDKGIVDTVRKSRTKAQEFFSFLFNYVIKYDDLWHTSLAVTCECGSTHRIHPSAWLKTLKTRSWVPIRKDKSEKPSAQYLSRILEGDNELLQLCKEDRPSELLSIFGVSISELMIQIAAKDERTRQELERAMGSLVSTFRTNLSQLNEIAKLAESDRDLFIDDLKERINVRNQINKNQDVGRRVERLLKEVLENEGFSVKRTGIGSDFLIEHDFVEDGQEKVLEIRKKGWVSYLEVKSTVQDHVKMTITQAKEARNKQDQYILCVVKLNSLPITDDSIKNNTYFVTDIGNMISDKVTKVENLETAQKKIIMKGDIEIELGEGSVRFRINERVWQRGKAFDQFLASLKLAKCE